MPTLTVRNLEEDIVRRLRVRAAEHGRSAEAEHREILRAVLTGAAGQQAQREQVTRRLAEFRDRTGGRGGSSAAQLLQESRAQRLAALTGADEAR